MSWQDLSIPVGDDVVAARRLLARSDGLATEHGRPCVVLAFGFAGTMDCGLDAFAERFAAVGLDAVTFDFRCFGRSTGEPRQTVDPARQREDYAAVVRHVRTFGDVDASRVVLWGVSLSAGHVLAVAAEDPRIAAVVALTPSVDGRASARHTRAQGTGAPQGPILRAIVADAVARRRGRSVVVPAAGRPGSVAVLTGPGLYDAYAGVAGPTWRNEVTALSLLRVGNDRVPLRRAADVGCPVLVQIADDDRSAPPTAAAAAASRAHAEVRHYACDHLDVHPGGAWHEHAVGDQVRFLRRHLASS